MPAGAGTSGLSPSSPGWGSTSGGRTCGRRRASDGGQRCRSAMGVSGNGAYVAPSPARTPISGPPLKKNPAAGSRSGCGRRCSPLTGTAAHGAVAGRTRIHRKAAASPGRSRRITSGRGHTAGRSCHPGTCSPCGTARGSRGYNQVKSDYWVGEFGWVEYHPRPGCDDRGLAAAILRRELRRRKNPLRWLRLRRAVRRMRRLSRERCNSGSHDRQADPLRHLRDRAGRRGLRGRHGYRRVSSSAAGARTAPLPGCCR